MRHSWRYAGTRVTPVELSDMPWSTLPLDAELPVREWDGTDPPPPGLSDAVLRVLGDTSLRARLREVDGTLCARLLAASFRSNDPTPVFEQVDVVLCKDGVVTCRRTISGDRRVVQREGLEDEWRSTPAAQRDASVAFMQILDAVVDEYDEVLHEIRLRVEQCEERLLAPNPPLNAILTDLLGLNRVLGTVRQGVLPIRSEIQELAELRDPVERELLSPSGARWMRSLERDLQVEVPSSLGVTEARISGALLQLQGERGEATNRMVLLLTILTVAFFVPTLFTGLYGMNVPLPGQRSETAFWIVVGMGVTLLGLAGAAITRLGLWGTFRSILPARVPLLGAAADSVRIVIRRLGQR